MVVNACEITGEIIPFKTLFWMDGIPFLGTSLEHKAADLYFNLQFTKFNKLPTVKEHKK